MSDYEEFLEAIFGKGFKNGGNRRTNQANQGRPTRQPNSGSRGSSTQRAVERAIAARQRARASQRASLSYMLGNHYLWLDEPKPKVRTKWAPPWMGGDLGKPNAALTWIPHEIGHMESEGIQAGEIIAYRAWYWDAKRERLRSIFVDYEWPINGPAIGQPGNGYGIHAFKSFPRVLQEYYNCISDILIGEVALWGDVIEFQGGYTAEFANVHRIYPLDFTRALDEKVIKLYLSSCPNA